MKIIFLHGLGQGADSWQEIRQMLPEQIATAAPELFADIKPTDEVSLASLNKQVTAYLAQQQEPYILCGLSLGGILALMASTQKNPQLKGLIVSGAQYQAPEPHVLAEVLTMMTAQPAAAFAGLGVTKEQFLGIQASLKDLHLKSALSKVTLPTLVICGGADEENLSAAHELADILPQATLAIVPKAGHVLNEEEPVVFSQLLQEFLATNF